MISVSNFYLEFDADGDAGDQSLPDFAPSYGWHKIDGASVLLPSELKDDQLYA